MNTTRTGLVSLILMLAFSSGIWAQGLPEYALTIPKKYVSPNSKTNYSFTDDRFSGRIWFVYGDRKNLRTSQSFKGAANYKFVTFGDVYVVVDEKEEFIHIVKDPDINYRGKLSPKAQDYGWVHKRNMLVWTKCLGTVTTNAASAGRLDRKAMIMNTLQSLENINKSKNQKYQELKSGRVNFYLDPDQRYPSGLTSGLFQIYFVFKETPTAYLLGKASNFDKGGQGIMKGWVPKERVISWDQRVAAEPNWTEESWKERSVSEKKIQIYQNKESAITYKNTGKGPNKFLVWNDDPGSERELGAYRRFPILDIDKSTNIMTLGVMGDINSENLTISAQEMATIQTKVTDVKAQRRRFDIVFVLDATASMDDYFPPVIKALEKAVDEISSNRGDKNEYRFGALTYRDIAEKQYLKEAQPLTSDINKVKNFLDNIYKNYESRNKFDKDIPEAMYFGLYNALRSLGMNPSHTNVVVLVGDAGNHARNDDSQVNEEDLISILNKYSANTIVFQAANRYSSSNPASASYEEFVDQSKTIIRSVAQKKYFEIKNAKNITDQTVSFPTWVQDADNPNIQRLKDGALSGCIMSCQPGYQLDANELQTELVRMFKDLRNATNQLLGSFETVTTEGEALNAVFEAIPESSSPYVSSFTPSMLLLLNEISGVSPDKLKMIAGKSYQMFMEGYSPIQGSGNTHPYFKSVLFVSRKELGDLIREMEKLSLTQSAGDLRVQMQNAWKELVRAHVGDIQRKELEKMSIEEISEKVFGLPSTSSFASIQIKDLTDESIVDDYKLNEYRLGIEKKIKDMNDIFNASPYKYSFVSNDVTYYWIEQDLLP